MYKRPVPRGMGSQRQGVSSTGDRIYKRLVPCQSMGDKICKAVIVPSRKDYSKVQFHGGYDLA